MVRETKEQEFLKVYEDLADSVFRHCYFRISDREKAKDLMQETFKRYWEYLDRSSAEVSNIKAFIFRIANNLLIDSYRRKKEESLDALIEDGFDPGENDDSILDLATGRELKDILAELEPKYRDPLVMRYVDDLPVKEIAALLGESENVVSVRIHRALKKLKEIIK